MSSLLKRGAFTICLVAAPHVHADEAMAVGDPVSPVACSTLFPVDDTVSTTRRVASGGASFVIPAGMQQSDHVEIDSRSSVWRGGDLTISHERGFVGGQGAGAKECLLWSGGEGVFASIEARGDRLILLFHSPGARDRSHAISTHGTGGASTEVAAMANILETFVFVDAWNGLRILEIDAGRGRFRYRNEIGMVRWAELGDIVTRDDGKVVGIEANRVIVKELIHDGVGGYEDVERVLSPSDRH